MGIDAYVYAKGSPTPEQIAAAEEFLKTRSWSDGDCLEVNRWQPDRVVLCTLDRLYEKGYERGSWPIIHNGILCMRAAFPECTIHYGGDYYLSEDDQDAPEATDELLAELWAHWLGPDGDGYHVQMRQSMSSS